MKIIIVGCGKVGQTLAAELNEEGNDIVVIDSDEVKARALATKYDLMGVIGNGATREIQKEAGIDSADLLIAVTGSDELNLLCCVMAKKTGDCRTIARVKSPEYASDAIYLKNELGLSMIINPEYAAAEEISRILSFPSAMKIDTFAKGKVELLKFRLPEGSPLVGLSVREVMTKFRYNMLICVVERGEESFIPNGSFVFEEKDIISIVAPPKSANAFFTRMGYKADPIKNAVIIGGTAITPYLIECLAKSQIKIKVIEKRRPVCEELAKKYGNVTVICGDPADEDTLREEGADKADAFIALTDMDEENILLSLFAKGGGARKVITKINRIDYDSVISKLDLDTTIYPKNITASKILHFVRASNNSRGSSMETLYSINEEVEAAEFIIGKNSPIAGTPLSQLKFKQGVLVAAVLRARQVIIPDGSTVIEEGDSIVAVTKKIALTNARDLLR